MRSLAIRKALSATCTAVRNVALPLPSRMLVVPLGLFGVVGAVNLRAWLATMYPWVGTMDNNIYTQVGLVLLVGLGAKNAILIVEFAKARRESGLSIEDASLEAAKLRFRPILMTAFAFILGVVPLPTSA